MSPGKKPLDKRPALDYTILTGAKNTRPVVARDGATNKPSNPAIDCRLLSKSLTEKKKEDKQYG